MNQSVKAPKPKPISVFFQHGNPFLKIHKTISTPPFLKKFSKVAVMWNKTFSTPYFPKPLRIQRPTCNKNRLIKPLLARNVWLRYSQITSMQRSLSTEAFSTCKPRDNNIRPTWSEHKALVLFALNFFYVQIYCNKLPSITILRPIRRIWIYTIKVIISHFLSSRMKNWVGPG